MIQHHLNAPPPKWRGIAHFQVDSSSFSGGHPQLHAPLFEFNPSLPLLNPPVASGSLQSPGDAYTKVSGHFIDDFLLNLHTQTH